MKKFSCSVASTSLAVLLFLSVAGAAFAVTPLKPKYISPQNGSYYASKLTSIILRPGDSLDPTSVNGAIFKVVGSLSKSHPGNAFLSDDKKTITFKPLSPFTLGERVTVTIVSGIRTAAGVTLGSTSWSFSISRWRGDHTFGNLARPTDPNSDVVNAPMYSVSNQAEIISPLDTLPSDFPALIPNIGVNPAPGKIFLASFEASYYQTKTIPYLLILNNDGSPFWYKRLTHFSVDFKVQQTGVLTFFDSYSHTFYAMDSSYRIVDSFACKDGYVTDLHDCWLLPNGHALLMACDTEIRDLSGAVKGGSPQAGVIGVVLQELDKNKNVVFQWSSLDSGHFNVFDAIHENFTAQYIDYVHCNAIILDTDGNIVISSRHLDEITKIDRETGEILWRWGGQNNQFKFLNDTLGFSHQHAIRRTEAGTFTMFDNGNYHPVQVSRGVEYRVDEKAKTCELVWQYHHRPEIFNAAMGNVQRLPNGNTLISWGLASSSPALTEVNPDGSLAYELVLGVPDASYRAFRFPWNPSVAAVTAVQANSISLGQNYPNPFNPSTTISYTLASAAHVTLSVYDMLGRQVAKVVDRAETAGNHSVLFSADALPSGTYSYKLTAGNFTQTKRMILMK